MTPQFKKAVETYGPRYMQDLGLTILQVSGIFGNFAVETGQFRLMQEIKPTIEGSRGGWGWAQWTGSRRKAFESWATANSYKWDDPEAFYRFSVMELQGEEKGALVALKRTKTLDTATTTFMKKYERPGIPHEAKRKAFALEALHVLEKKLGLEEKPKAAPMGATGGRGPEGREGIKVPQASAVQPPVTASRSAGGLLSGFWALFQGKPPVKAADRAGVVAETKAEAPSLSKELGGIRLAGFGTLLAGVAGGAQDTGLLDTVKGTADQATDTFQSVQQLVNLIFGLLRWAVTHWWVGAIVIGVYLAVKVGWAVYKVYAQIQHTRAMEQILRKE